MRATAYAPDGITSPMPDVTGIPDGPDRWLLMDFLADADRSEDLVLAALDRVEQGIPEFNWGDHYVWVEMYPDDRVVITQNEDLVDEDGDSEHPPQTTITISEARQLLLDWLKAKEAWYAELRKKEAGG